MKSFLPLPSTPLRPASSLPVRLPFRQNQITARPEISRSELAGNAPSRTHAPRPCQCAPHATAAAASWQRRVVPDNRTGSRRRSPATVRNAAASTISEPNRHTLHGRARPGWGEPAEVVQSDPDPPRYDNGYHDLRDRTHCQGCSGKRQGGVEVYGTDGSGVHFGDGADQRGGASKGLLEYGPERSREPRVQQLEVRPSTIPHPGLD